MRYKRLIEKSIKAIFVNELEKFFVHFIENYEKYIETIFSGLEEVEVSFGLSPNSPDMVINGFKIDYEKSIHKFFVKFFRDGKIHCEIGPAEIVFSAFACYNYRRINSLWFYDNQKAFILFEQESVPILGARILASEEKNVLIEEKIIKNCPNVQNTEAIILSIEELDNKLWKKVKILDVENIKEFYFVNFLNEKSLFSFLKKNGYPILGL